MTAVHWQHAVLDAYAAVTAAGPPGPADHPDDVAPANYRRPCGGCGAVAWGERVSCPVHGDAARRAA